MAAKPKAKRAKGEPAPWMGDVARVWADAFPGSGPAAGAATALRPAITAHGLDVVLPRLAVYLRATPATYIRLDKFAATVLAPEWRPTGAQAVATGTPAERIAAVLLDADAVGVDPNTAEQRLTLAVHTGAVPREAAADACRLIRATRAVIPRDRDKAIRQVETLLAATARKAEKVPA